MATETLPHINAAAAVVVRNMDCESQRHAILIQSMCRAAQHLLMKAGPFEVADAYRLLDEIWDKADTMMNRINCEAERMGANFKDEAEDKIESAILEAFIKHAKEWTGRPDFKALAVADQA